MRNAVFARGGHSMTKIHSSYYKNNGRKLSTCEKIYSFCDINSLAKIIFENGN